MTPLLERAIAKIRTLSEHEQDAYAVLILDLVADIRARDESLARPPDVSTNLAEGVPPWLRDELDRRIANHEVNPEAGASWEEVKAHLANRSKTE